LLVGDARCLAAAAGVRAARGIPPAGHSIASAANNASSSRSSSSDPAVDFSSRLQVPPVGSDEAAANCPCPPLAARKPPVRASFAAGGTPGSGGGRFWPTAARLAGLDAGRPIGSGRSLTGVPARQSAEAVGCPFGAAAGVTGDMPIEACLAGEAATHCGCWPAG
jgi:hypothetical protein